MNPYDVLEVTPRASAAVIKAAFHALVKEFQVSDPRRYQAVVEAKDELLDSMGNLRRVAEPPKKGKKIGPYRLLDKIAEGGFGVTYRAVHEMLNAPVCIKHAFNVSPQDEEIMKNEALAIWDLRHHSLPNMRDMLKLEDGSVALVMSFIPGPTLMQCVEKYGPLDPEDVAWITSRMLNPLQYLHLHGRVHGDVKPQNVIVQEDQHAIVMVDFGLSAIKPTSSSSAKGFTPFFAPPEQEGGMPLIPQSDFYGLGMTMIYALGGDIEAKTVPDDTPPNMVKFIKSLIRHDPMARPDWRRGNVCEDFQRVREADFGRAYSSLKPLGRKPAARR
jgi:serine/threonine protein kinase